MPFELTPEQRALRASVPLVDGIPDNWEILPQPKYQRAQYAQDTLTETSGGWGFIEHPVDTKVIRDTRDILVRSAELSAQIPTRHEIHLYWSTRGASSGPFLVSPEGQLYPNLQVIRMDPGINGVGIASDRNTASKGAAPINCYGRQNQLQCDGSIPVHMILGFPTRAQVSTAQDACRFARQLMDPKTLAALIEWYRFVWDREGAPDAPWINADAWSDESILGRHMEKVSALERSAPNGVLATRERAKYDAACADLVKWKQCVKDAYAIVNASATPEPTESVAAPDPIESIATPSTKRNRRNI